MSFNGPLSGFQNSPVVKYEKGYVREVTRLREQRFFRESHVLARGISAEVFDVP